MSGVGATGRISRDGRDYVQVGEKGSVRQRSRSDSTISGGRGARAAQKTSTDSEVADIPLNLREEVLSAMRILKEQGFAAENLREALRNVSRNVAFGLFEGRHEPAFVNSWEIREGRVVIGGMALQDLIKDPSQEQLDAMKAQGIKYEPMPEAAKKALLDAEQALLGGATAVSVITPGCNGTNFVQVITEGGSFHIEHVGSLEELKYFQEKVMEALGLRDWSDGGLDKASVSHDSVHKLDWKALAEYASAAAGRNAGSMQTRWAERLAEYSQDPGGRQRMLEELAGRLEERLLSRILPLFERVGTEIVEDLEREVLGARTVAEHILADELQGRFLGSVKQGWEPKQAPQVLERERNVEPARITSWYAVAENPQVQLLAQGIRAQVAERHDLASHGLVERLDALLLMGSAPYTSRAVDVKSIADLCRTVAAYTNNPQLSRHLYTLAENLERELKEAWRAVRDGEIPIPAQAAAASYPEPVNLNPIEMRDAATSPNGLFAPELQALLDEMALQEERRKEKKQNEDTYSSYFSLIGRRSANPLLAALRYQAPLPEALLTVLNDKALQREIRAIMDEEMLKIEQGVSSADTQAATRIAVEPEEMATNHVERADVFSSLIKRIGEGERLKEARRKWAPLRGTEAYEPALILELIEVLNLPVEERQAILVSAGIDQEEVVLLERIERQLVMEHTFRSVPTALSLEKAA